MVVFLGVVVFVGVMLVFVGVVLNEHHIGSSSADKLEVGARWACA